MSVRAWIEETLAAILDFGKITKTGQGLLNSVQADVEVAGDSAEDQELWGLAPVLYRPTDPDPTGYCEALIFRRGDEKVIIGTKDRRYQVSLEKGDVVITSLSLTTPTRVKLLADGTCIIDASSIKLGASAAQFVARADKVDTELKKLWQALDTHIHPMGAEFGTGAGALTAPPSARLTNGVTTWEATGTGSRVTNPGSVESSKTKTE